jgi:hypothetical protein
MVPKPLSRTSLNVFLEKHWFVDAFWSAFGSIVVPFVFHLATTLWGPIGYLWHHFWYHFRSYVLRFLCTWEARKIEHLLLLNYFGVISVFLKSVLCQKCSFGEPFRTPIGAQVAPQIGPVASRCCHLRFLLSAFPQGGIWEFPSLDLEFFN